MSPSHSILSRATAVGALVLAPAMAAAGWTNVPVNPHLVPYISQIRVCKTTVSSIYGPLWRANYQVFRRDARIDGIAIRALRLPSRQELSRESNFQWLYGVVAGTGGNVYASPFYDDHFHLSVFYTGGILFPGTTVVSYADTITVIKASQVANC